MDLKLAGLRALVTGASRGLGYETALGLAREGAHVLINARTPERLSQAASQIRVHAVGRVEAFPGDLTKAQVAIDLVNKAVEFFGGLDLLVTNTGGPPSGKFEDFDDEAWSKSIDLNLMSHVRLVRAALPHLRLSKSASVLTITSYAVKQPIPNLVLSNSVRLATIGLTKSLALELGRDGIRFNSILPAWTDTERVQELMEARASLNSTTVQEEINKQARESPLGRMGEPYEFANAAVFLLSPAASYLTGVMLTVDGGMYKGTF